MDSIGPTTGSPHRRHGSRPGGATRRPAPTEHGFEAAEMSWTSHRGVTVFELAKIMGSSVRMIERHYGALLDGAGAGISGRLDALEAELGAKARVEAEGKG